MMATILEVRESNMWSIFKSRKQVEKEREAEAKDREIEKLKESTFYRANAANEAMTELNKLIEQHGVSGLIYFSTGKGRKK